MKKTISKILIFLFLFNIIMPFSVCATNGMTIYNCGKVVSIDYGIEQYYGKNYINEKDLANINLHITSKSIIANDGTVDMKLYPGSSIVVVNGTSITYPNATVETDRGLYICIELLAMFFSEIYEVDDTTIKLWISDFGYDFARGIVSLPSGDVAPTGGVEVEVFVAEIPSSTPSSGLIYANSNYELNKIGQVGYKQSEKPMYDESSKAYNAFLNYNRRISSTVIIPEGENSVEYTLSIQNDDFENCIVGYYTEINQIPFYGKLNYKGTDVLYNFNLSTTRPLITGNISLPQDTENDVEFRVIAHGKYDFIYDGVVAQGENTAAYSIAVDKNSTYSIELIFIEGEYSRVTIEEDVIVKNISVDGIDIMAEAADEYIVNLSLPTDYDAGINSINLKVYLQMATSPYYLLDVESVRLDNYSRNKDVLLFDDIQCKNVICYYVLSNDYNGLFNFGHYSKNATSFDVAKADRITTDDDSIDMPLLKSKEINATFTLPDNDIAEEDIKIDAYPITVTYPIEDNNMAVVGSPSSPEDEGDDVYELPTTIYPVVSDDDIVSITPINSGSVTLLSSAPEASNGASGGGASVSHPVAGTAKPTIIAKGESEGDKIISVPDEEGYGFLLEFYVSGGAKKYYSKTYYNEIKTSTSRENAIEISNKTDSINIELMRQFYVSGNVNAVGFEDSHNRITIAAQTSDAVINDIYHCDFSVYTEIYGNGDYGLYIPEEFKKYILRLNSFNSGRAIYYKTDKCVDELNKAEVLTITEDTSNVNFSYSGYNPSIPIVLKCADENFETGERNIMLKNIGDFDTDDITLYVGFYNGNGVLTQLISEDVGLVEAQSVRDLYITIPNQYIQNASIVKVFAWSDLKPVANVIFIKNNVVDETKIATAFMQLNDTSVYCYGEEYIGDYSPVIYDGLLYAPIGQIAEVLEWKSVWDSAALQLMLKKGDERIILTANQQEAYINGDNISLMNVPKVIDGVLMLPLEHFASYMGYECVQNEAIGTVAMYDSIDWKVKAANENGLITHMFENRNIKDNITRLEAVSLIMNMYEKIIKDEIEIAENPFIDCDEESVIKAYSLGLIGAKLDQTFNPDDYLTRAEFIKLTYSLLIKLGLYIPIEAENTDEFSNVLSNHWANQYIYGIKELGILDDLYSEIISVDAYMPLREAIAIINNGYNEITKCEFTDVSPDSPYILAINNVYNRKVLVGYEDGTFKPDHSITRAEVTAILMRMDGKEPAMMTDFSCEDVKSDHWASGCIEYCINEGYFALENNLFRPNEAITISETIDAFMNFHGYSPNLNAQDKISEATDLGMLKNIKEITNYDSFCRRDIMAQLINNTLNLK